MGDPGLIPGLGRSLGVGNSNPLQYSCLENSMDRPTPAFLPREFHGQRSLAGYNSTGSQRVGHNWELMHTSEALHWEAPPRTAASSALSPWWATANIRFCRRPSLTGRSGSVSCGVTGLFPWFLVHAKFCLCPPRVSISSSPVDVL